MDWFVTLCYEAAARTTLLSLLSISTLSPCYIPLCHSVYDILGYIYIYIYIYIYTYMYIYIQSILMKIVQFQGIEAMRGQN